MIVKSKINQILKNKLKISYRKTTIKNLKNISPLYLKMANIYLKILIRPIKLYIDFFGWVKDTTSQFKFTLFEAK